MQLEIGNFKFEKLKWLNNGNRRLNNNVRCFIEKIP
jgi:hypothetical protein